MHKKKLILALAAALVVLTGSAFAAAYQAGVLDYFLPGRYQQFGVLPHHPVYRG